ncbi:MAG: hypothetical protein ACRD3Q_02025 [Terriglobales bacterium]
MDLAPVFAPTKSYERAWAVLQKYHFAVLEGPPEVGKSAIAWVIGLTQAGEGWEAVVCRTPDTFFQAIDRNQPQVFIADDAFGRTEYDPTRTSKWEADLDHILHRLDPHHWLIWTSRRHILKRACDRMDAQGKARSFPDPGSVLVDVKTLSAEERALILFRHAKSANLESFAKKIIRQHAKLIVSNAEFTPERVRRFVKETLPKLASATASRKINNAQLNEAVGEALRNPTKQMRLAFRSLPAAHKWFLVAFLEVSEVETPFLLYSGGNAEEVRELYEEYCPDKHHEPFEQVLEQLTEAFVSTKQSNYLGTKVDWIHPSYRDLVIDELVEDAELRNTFLRRASLEGVKLALSGIGGQYGERQMPFMSSRESWDILRQRCLSLVATNNVDREMLEIVAEAASESVSRGQHSALIAILNPVCQAIGEKWDREGRLISAIELEAFGTARKHSKPKIPCPSLDSSWDSLEERLRENMSAARRGSPFDFEAFDRLAAFAQAVRTCSPGFLSRKGFPEVYEGEIRMLMEEAKSQLEAEPFSDAPDDIRNLADRVSSNGSTVERLIDLSALYAKPASNLAHQLERRSEKLAEIAAENEPGEPGDDYDRGEPSDSSAFDIGLLFSEL